MAKAICCDRCGEHFKVDKDKRYDIIAIEKASLDPCYGTIEEKYFDLCPDCASKLKKFMEGEAVDHAGAV